MLQMAATTASMLNFSWAETGMIGARRAVVPKPRSAGGSKQVGSVLFHPHKCSNCSSGLTLDKLLDTLAMLHGLALSDQVHLVLQDDNVVRVDTDNLESSQVFSGLRLRAGLVSGDEKKGTIHCQVSYRGDNRIG
jgi:hypothetical protein